MQQTFAAVLIVHKLLRIYTLIQVDYYTMAGHLFAIACFCKMYFFKWVGKAAPRSARAASSRSAAWRYILLEDAGEHRVLGAFETRRISCQPTFISCHRFLAPFRQVGPCLSSRSSKAGSLDAPTYISLYRLTQEPMVLSVGMALQPGAGPTQDGEDSMVAGACIWNDTCAPGAGALGCGTPGCGCGCGCGNGTVASPCRGNASCLGVGRTGMGAPCSWLYT